MNYTKVHIEDHSKEIDGTFQQKLQKNFSNDVIIGIEVNYIFKYEIWNSIANDYFYDFLDEKINDKDRKLIRYTTLIYNDNRIRLCAIGDCCSFSWIDEYNESFQVLIGKKIISLQLKEKIKDQIKLDKSDIQKEDKNYLYEIKYLNDNSEIGSFEFILRNSSNGYYSGWIEIYQE